MNRTDEHVGIRSGVLAPVALGAALIAAWHVATALGVLDEFYVSRPGDVAERIGEWTRTGYLWPHLWITVQEAAWALVLGAASGLAAGLVLARLPGLDRTVGPYLRMANAVPRIVLAPLFVLWFGLGAGSKIALGVSLVFFIVYFTTYQAVRDVDVTLLNNARMLGATERQLARHVLVPSALSAIFASLHVCVGIAIVGAVVGEYLGSTQGVGYVISQSEGLFDTTGVIAGLVVLMSVVLVVDALVARLERRLLRWKQPTSDGR